MTYSYDYFGDIILVGSPKNLQLKVSTIGRNWVLLQWDTYCVEDIRKLLGYSIYYIQAEQNVTVYGQRDACSDL